MKTPRTDEALRRHYLEGDFFGEETTKEAYEFARELERELIRRNCPVSCSSISEDDMETIKKIADLSYKRWINTGSVRGQMLTARDDYLFHIIIATENFIRQIQHTRDI